MSTSQPALHLTSSPHGYDLWRKVHAGDLERIRRGAYAESVDGSEPLHQALIRARLHIEAVARQSSAALWFSHQSAALLHGLPTLMVPRFTHVTHRYRRSGRADPRVRRHHLDLPEQDQATVGGIPVTTLERTALDCARTRNVVEAVMILDAFLHRHGSVTNLTRRLDAMPGERGVRLARSHLAWADAGAESPGESRTRVVLLQAGLRPQTQIGVITPLGRFWLDMGWPEEKVGLEYDGQVKYTRLANGDPSAVVVREKERQDALEAEGWTVLRASTADLRQPSRLIAAVRDRLARRTRR